jgi:hypothetical protein
MFLGDQIKRKGDQLLPPGIPASETGLGKGLLSFFKLTTHLELVLQIMLETHPQDSSVPSLRHYFQAFAFRLDQKHLKKSSI